MRLHVLSVPHTQTTREYSWCAFTSLTLAWCSMMTDLGHEVFLYAGEHNEASVKEHIHCADTYEWHERIPPYESTHLGWMAFASRAIEELSSRYEQGDYLCLAAGRVQQPIADAFAHAPVVEFITGYEGVMDRSFRVFPSYAWMHAVYGWSMGANRADGRFYDAVIPHFLDPKDNPLGQGGEYILYVGRLTGRKGLQVVADVAERTGLPLVVAGFGEEHLIPKGAMFVGSVEPKQRAELMGNARCVLMPTLYVEPFGLVAIEAQMAGTPAITTDFGAFPETVEQGVSGFRCHTLREFCDAVWESPRLDRDVIRQRALSLYSTQAVGPMYQSFFERLETLKGRGWYE